MLWWYTLRMRMGSKPSRIRAIEQIGASGNVAGVEPLIGVAGEALRNGDTAIQEAVAKALALLAHADGLPALIALLESGQDEGVQLMAIEGLKRIKDEGVVKPLVRALGDMRDVRQAAIEALTALGATAAAPLLTALTDKKKEVRAGAAEALAAMGEQAVPVLIACLSDKVTEQRVAAAEVLIKINQPAIGPLIKALAEPNENCRQLAAEILGHLGSSDAQPALVKLLRDPSGNVRAYAMRALEALKWQPTDSDERALCAVVRGDWDEAVQIGPATIPYLIADFKDPDMEVRQAISKTLIAFGKDSVEPLIDALRSEDQQTRFHAAIALGDLGDSRAVDALITALHDQDVTVRENVVVALWKLKGPKASDGLIAALKDEDRAIRSRAARALGELNDRRAVEPLLEAAQDAETRLAATFALWQIAPTKAIKPLALLARDEASAEEAIMALGQLLDSAAERLDVDDLRALAHIMDDRESGPDDADAPARPAVVKRSADPAPICARAREELRRRGAAV